MNFSGVNLKPTLGLLALTLFACLVTFAPSATGSTAVEIDRLIWLASVVLAGLVLQSWAPKTAHLSLLGLILVYLIGSVGLLEMAIGVLWLVSMYALGAVVLRWCYLNGKEAAISITEATLVGAAVWLGAVGVMLHFAVNLPRYYLGLTLLPFLCLYGLPKGTISALRTRTLATHDWMRSIPFWAWCVGLAIIGWVLRWSAFPSMAYDDHAGHLRLWTELLTEKRALFDVKAQLWSVAPFASDLLYAGLSLMAGTDARSATNLLLALSLLVLMARILQRLNVPSLAQWLLVVLMASTPMLGNLLLSMQTELALAVVGLAGLRLVIDADGGWRGQHVMGVLTASALCAAIKLPGAILGVTLVVALIMRLWGKRSSTSLSPAYLNWPALLMLAVVVFVALHSYATAWLTTGNPFFPLYNAIFKSPDAPISNFSDARWIRGFGIRNYVRAFFHTSEFFEGGDGTAGWQYLLLLPAALIALWRPSAAARIRLGLVPLFGFGFAMFAATQYWRYMFPIMPIAGILMAALLTGKNQNLRRAFYVLVTVCIMLNMVCFTQISWMMGMPAGIAYTQAEKQKLVSQFAPAAVLTEKINQLAPGSRVLYPEDTPYGGILQGSPLYVNWYSPARSERYHSIKASGDVKTFLEQEKIDFVIFSLADTSTSNMPNALMRMHLAQFGTPLAQEGTFILYGLKDAPSLYQNVFDLRTAMLKEPGAPELQIPIAESGLVATAEPKVLANLPIFRSKQARYSIRFHCPSNAGSFIAQINWNKGGPYYRLVSCEADTVSFSESVPIPLGVTQGSLYVTVRDTASAQVEELAVEVN